jgi:hypothetical protein
MADARSRPCNLALRPSPVNGRAALVITADGIYPGVFGRLARPAPWCVVTGDAAHGGADRTGDGERAGLRLWACLVVAWDGHGTGDAEGSLPPELDVSVGAPAVFCSYCRFRSRCMPGLYYRDLINLTRF